MNVTPGKPPTQWNISSNGGRISAQQRHVPKEMSPSLNPEGEITWHRFFVDLGLKNPIRSKLNVMVHFPNLDCSCGQ